MLYRDEKFRRKRYGSSEENELLQCEILEMIIHIQSVENCS